MAYTPSEWSCGDIVTADKLNNIERGIAEVNSEYVPTSWQCGDLITAEAMNKIEQGIADAGGGSSDFSTAEVTLDLTNLSREEYAFNLTMPAIVTSPVGDIVIGHIGENDLTGAISTFNAVLTTNGCFAALDTLDVSVAVSGSISQIGEAGETTNYLITGDCTITIS